MPPEDAEEYYYRVVRFDEGGRLIVASVELETEVQALVFLVRFLRYSNTPAGDKQALFIQRRIREPKWEAYIA